MEEDRICAEMINGGVRCRWPTSAERCFAPTSLCRQFDGHTKTGRWGDPCIAAMRYRDRRHQGETEPVTGSRAASLGSRESFEEFSHIPIDIWAVDAWAVVDDEQSRAFSLTVQRHLNRRACRRMGVRALSSRLVSSCCSKRRPPVRVMPGVMLATRICPPASISGR